MNFKPVSGKLFQSNVITYSKLANLTSKHIEGYLASIY